MTSVISLVGRALMAAIFIEYGLFKLINPAGTIAYMAGHNLPLPTVTFVVVVAVELLGGLAILVGFQTRIVAGLLAAYCIATAFIAHNHPDVPEQMIQFMKNVCMAGGFLQLVAFGPGRYRVSGN